MGAHVIVFMIHGIHLPLDKIKNFLKNRHDEKYFKEEDYEKYFKEENNGEYFKEEDNGEFIKYEFNIEKYFKEKYNVTILQSCNGYSGDAGEYYACTDSILVYHDNGAYDKNAYLEPIDKDEEDRINKVMFDFDIQDKIKTMCITHI